ncbi:MAG: trypsin-like peptidase domain-containing protein [Polyangiaceae bacterium]|nr:trypsin-like peptidase domain-containing protein [Polyangiaceae bacterium]
MSAGRVRRTSPVTPSTHSIAADNSDPERPPIRTKYSGGTPKERSTVKDLDEVAFEREPGKVFRKDDRQRVAEPVSPPYRHICALRIRAADGKDYVGTGFVISPRTVITAGHCLYVHAHGSYAQHVTIIPALRGTRPGPYGEITSSSFDVHPGWLNDQNEAFDFGAIFLSGAGFTNCGAMGFASLSDTLLIKKELTVSGYPRDCENGTWPYQHARRVKQLHSHFVRYQTDTWGGQSGSPVWTTHEGKRYAVAIHTSGGPAFNQAVRIIKPIFEQLLTWKKQGM